MGTGRPSGMSTIIKSTPTPMPCTTLKARALLDLYSTIQTTFSMILIAKLDYFHHEAIERKRRGIPSQERLAYPPIPWGRHCAAYGMH
jgi:hypothetical protein